MNQPSPLTTPRISPIEDDWFMFDRQTNSRQWRQINSCRVSGRSGHATANCRGKSYSFGGFQEGKVSGKALNDLQAFDFESKKWETIKVKGKLPLPRASAVFCYDGNGCIYLIGGINGPRGEICKDMQKFSIETKTWSTVEVIDETAGSAFGLYGQSLSRFRQSLYIFGGCRGSSYSRETFLYDIPSKRIKILDCWGHIPFARYKHEAFVETNTVVPSLYVLGGGDFLPRTLHLDINCLNLQTLEWRRLSTTGGGPSSRLAFSLCQAKNENTCYVYGGLGITMERYSDLYCLYLKSLTWRKICSSNTPGKRAFHTSCFEDGEIFIFGGADRVETGTWCLFVQQEVPKLTVLAARQVGITETEAQSPKYMYTSSSKYSSFETLSKTLQASKSFVPDEVLTLVHSKES